MGSYDLLVVSGGIAGVSLAYELADDYSVGLVEMEDRLAYHTTGRSVATFLESYGGRTIRRLTTASRSFMEDPPEGFTRPILTSLPLMWVVPEGEEADLRSMAAAVSEFVPVEVLSPADVAALTTVFRPGWVALGLLEPGSSEIDVHALHGGYAAGLRRRGGVIHLAAGVTAMVRTGDRWRVTDRTGTVHEAAVVVNASGAWCDRVATMAGAEPVTIHPLRRTVFTFTPPVGVDMGQVSLVGDVSGQFYFKREGPNVLGSPADEVPSEPCDARVEEVDVARAIEIINAATRFDIRHVQSSWAGLRSFVADRSPVCGFDDQVEGFFWFVGQGGYGIQMSPALARAGAALIRSGHLPDDLVARGIEPTALGRQRLAGLTGLSGH